MEEMSRKYPSGVFDMIFADPPYLLSNGGITCHSGKRVNMDKGKWDKSRASLELSHEHNSIAPEILRRGNVLMERSEAIGKLKNKENQFKFLEVVK